MNWNRERHNQIKTEMEEAYKNFLYNAHTLENEVKTKYEERYFYLDGVLIWIPTYLYKFNQFRTFKKSSI